MKTTILVFAIATLAMTFGAAKSAESTKCHIGDSALCLAEPGCYWDVNKRGCFEGELEAKDACAAHEDEGVCSTDVSLGCKWDAEKMICALAASPERY